MKGSEWSERTDTDLLLAYMVNGIMLSLARCSEDHNPKTNCFARAHREILAEMKHRALKMPEGKGVQNED